MVMDGDIVMNRIKDLRKANKFKQTELCKMLGVTQGALSGWESGRYEPDIKSLNKMSEIFNVSVDYLLGNTEIKDKPTNIKSLVVSDDDIKFALFEGEKEITDQMYEEVKRFAKYILETNKKKRDESENNGNNEPI